ncbi:hypothetical protein KHA80_19935 [Anaerobacillus sp. HL2]|nr:hypothetical protein KHA80_19935 [Anaerobacillus sp. HL2]
MRQVAGAIHMKKSDSPFRKNRVVIFKLAVQEIHISLQIRQQHLSKLRTEAEVTLMAKNKC